MNIKKHNSGYIVVQKYFIIFPDGDFQFYDHNYSRLYAYSYPKVLKVDKKYNGVKSWLEKQIEQMWSTLKVKLLKLYETTEK